MHIARHVVLKYLPLSSSWVYEDQKILKLADFSGKNSIFKKEKHENKRGRKEKDKNIFLRFMIIRVCVFVYKLVREDALFAFFYCFVVGFF